MDPESQVSKKAKLNEKDQRDRQYEVMPELNYQPAVTYLKKVNTRVAGDKKGSQEKSHA